MNAIEVSELRKLFGEVVAVDGLSFAVPQGAIVGLLGGNGAGKTTTLSMLLGLLLPSSGTLKVLGEDMLKHRYRVLGRMNFSSPYVDLPHRLTVAENLMVYARLYGVRDRRARLKMLAADLDIDAFLATEDSLIAGDTKLREGLNRIVQVFPNSALYRAFCAHGPVQREVPFLLPLGGVMLKGTIDALLADHTVVDFKTGKRDAPKLEQYTWQLQLYAWAIEKLTGKAPTRAVLYFVDEDQELEVDVTPIAVADTYARAEAALRGA